MWIIGLDLIGSCVKYYFCLLLQWKEKYLIMMKMRNEDFNHVTTTSNSFCAESTEFIQVMLNPDVNGHI